MAKYNDTRVDISHDNGVDINNGIDSDLGAKLASEHGVDLNASDITETDSTKEYLSKATIMYYIPPPPPEIPAEIREIDSPQIETTDETNSNYWEEMANNLNNYLEDLGGATSQMQEDKNTRAENDETAASLNKPMFADHCDPPETEPADMLLEDLNTEDIT
jgi:hypothetical protein